MLPAEDFHYRFQQGFVAAGDAMKLGPIPAPGGGDYSVSFWFKAFENRGAGLPHVEPLVGQGDCRSPNPGWRFLISDGVLGFSAHTVQGKSASVSAPIRYDSATWTHVVGTIDREATGGGRLKLYVDGRAPEHEGSGFGAKDDRLSSGDVSSGAQSLHIAGYGSSGGHGSEACVNQYFRGRIDDLRIWFGHALSAKEVQNLHRNVETSERNQPNFWETIVFERELHPDPHEDICYRIPNILKHPKTHELWAVAQRKHPLYATSQNKKTCVDYSPNDLVLSKSVDGQGLEFSAPRVIVACEAHNGTQGKSCRGVTGMKNWVTLGSSPWVVDNLHRVWLLHTVARPERDADGRVVWSKRYTKPKLASKEAWAVRLDDEGHVAERVRLDGIERAMPGHGWGFGPANGILMSQSYVPDGTRRMIVPGKMKKHGNRSVVFHSDDNGATWQVGGATLDECDDAEGQPEGCSSESTVVEVATNPAVLMLNSRRAGKHMSAHHTRSNAFSLDGGMTWGPSIEDPTLVGPVSHASMATIESGGQRYVLYAGPSCQSERNANYRRQMTVRVGQYDARMNGGAGGIDWQRSRIVRLGSAGYSSLMARSPTRIGLLYEAPIAQSQPANWQTNELLPAPFPRGMDYARYTRGITYADFSLEWVDASEREDPFHDAVCNKCLLGRSACN